MSFVVALNSDARINIHTGEMTNASPDANYQLNIHSGELELAEPGSTHRLNIHTGEFELAPPGAQYRLNIHSGEFELGNPSSGKSMSRRTYGSNNLRSNTKINIQNNITKRRYKFD